MLLGKDFAYVEGRYLSDIMASVQSFEKDILQSCQCSIVFLSSTSHWVNSHKNYSTFNMVVDQQQLQSKPPLIRIDAIDDQNCEVLATWFTTGEDCNYSQQQQGLKRNSSWSSLLSMESFDNRDDNHQRQTEVPPLAFVPAAIEFSFSSDDSTVPSARKCLFHRKEEAQGTFLQKHQKRRHRRQQTPNFGR